MSTSAPVSATNGTTARGGAGTRGRLPAPRRDRRPAMAALALLLVLAGALGSALVAFRSGSRVDVLVARRDVPVGAAVGRDDLTTARVAADGVALIPADAAASYYGRHAVSRIPAGAPLTDAMLHPGDPVPAGAELVGVVIDLSRRTTSAPAPGDVVRAYRVAGSGGSGTPSAGTPRRPVVPAAQVVEVGDGGGGGALSLTLLLSSDVAGEVANLAATQSLALTVLAPDTEPDVAMNLG